MAMDKELGTEGLLEESLISDLYATSLLNCIKSGKNTMFTMVEYTVVK